MEKKCERCGAVEGGRGPNDYSLMDYCAVCSKDLCEKCMEKGCCGNVPAKSGTNADFGDDE